MSFKLYISQVVVQATDLDELEHVNNIVYFSYLQKVAIEHWYSAVPTYISEALRWVVKKHEIEYFKPAFLNDLLTIKTWIGSFGGVTCVRFYEIHRNADLIVKAQTQWVALDPKTMKPKRLDVTRLEEIFILEKQS
jgi:acyl-CoA thioester hydrolase